jgi:hypothetical protein
LVRCKDHARTARSRAQSNAFGVGENIMPIKLEDYLFSLEEKFWTEGAEYYQQNLAYAAIMVFPDPAGVMVKDEIASSLEKKARWSRVALEEHRLLELNDAAAVVTYKATARRADGGKAYVARASSAYVRDGSSWKLAFHQQTPV